MIIQEPLFTGKTNLCGSCSFCTYYYFLLSAGGPAATNKDEVEINGYNSDDCESVSSMASSIESHAIDDNNEGIVFDRHFR